MNLKKIDIFRILPYALVLGGALSALQSGNWLWLLGFLSFSFLFLLSFSLLRLSLKWANAGKTLAWIVVLAFALRLIVGISIHLALPIYGHDDVDDKAGFVFTDAHRRDDQAWDLAASDRPIIDAFTDKFAYDQYGGLLAFSAFVYRYFSPDAHRPLMLVLISSFTAALGIPFLWKAVSQVFGEKVAWASAWIFVLYPESILLGASAMREPYLLTFSALALWGFINSGVKELSAPKGYAPASDSELSDSRAPAKVMLGIGLLGMLLVSPAIALATLIIFAGWMFFTSERGNISWQVIFIFIAIFVFGLFFLSASLNRSGEFDSTSPFHVINGWLRLAVKWDAYQLERESGWVQKIFRLREDNEAPAWIRLPFVAIYGIFQPVLPAAIIHPTKLIWMVIGFLRGLGWYAVLPLLILSFGAAAGSQSSKMRAERSAALSGEAVSKGRSVILWLALFSWTWILLAALRGGGDLWDNPRYRTIMFMWQSIIAGYVWVWWRETGNAWFKRILAMEGVFLLVFTQWYASRYFYLGGQLPFAVMVALILGLWGLILGAGWWQDWRAVKKMGTGNSHDVEHREK
ncbi:MAG: hypothetical protein L0287_02805 [Anaerolineae bacterium]|nr:hypothetical protein [Anaerolineae bacterium]MCI0608120.1 hypothetical protein [Anaerolineae bacterium]